jgi:transcriptional regulator with XRE-family HTH domain
MEAAIESDRFDWRARLRRLRMERGVSFADLARRSGLSLSAVKRYEGGSRNPSEASLNAIIDALGLPRESANEIRAGAGFAVDVRSLFGERYVTDPQTLEAQAGQLPWPVFVSNMSFDIVIANQPFQRLIGVDLDHEFTGTGERNLLAGAGFSRFATRAQNYEELVGFMIGLAKADPRFAQNPERPAPWLREAMSRFLDGNPIFIRRFLDLWESVEPVPHRTRHNYRVVWKADEGDLIRFIGELTIGDIWNELSWNEWIPADVESWRALSRRTVVEHPLATKHSDGS